ncbi:putative late blight resistance protein homolog R1A-3 isoform X1 [Olea europaea var. sylvestris]|uniref:putative late blight resistance protein homolog R1A-3 isoform X1 n=1 Tax=Olea europaea var. sylvestris TaxID=158386 RepID=UPI000C1D6AA5|nr:putative late blight resistance protein homolog R1A-3 isoform X1 [Olea europaea var. sylvestris]
MASPPHSPSSLPFPLAAASSNTTTANKVLIFLLMPYLIQTKFATADDDVAMEFSIGEFLLQYLKQLLDYHPNVIIDAKEQVEHLYKQLSLFIDSAKESMENRNPSYLEKYIVKQVRNLIYRSEDTVDKYISLAIVHKSRNQFIKAIHTFDYAAILRKLTSDIESINAEVKNISNIKVKIERVEIVDRHDNYKKAPFVEDDNVVGFQDEMENIITLLTHGSKELEVISIIGMPGIGKTTLAKMIYHHHKIKDGFSNRAWIYVSQSYNRKEVFLTILNHFIKLNDEMYGMTDEHLGEELFKFLKERKYLIVIDDVWTQEAWNHLENVLPKNKQQSRILLTSRIWSVAKHANPYRDPHKLRLLSREESWALLQKRVLFSKACHLDLIRHGMRIVDHCKGLPLALVIIGRILLERGTTSYWWEKVANCVNTYLSLDPQERMDEFVAKSFYQLPYHLKECFLYFGMLPGDFQISKQELIRMWIAEGFIQQKNKMSLEDIAEQFLEDLVDQNLVMVGKRGSNGAIKTCQVHEMVREFCKKEAEDENLFLEVKFDDQRSCLFSYLKLIEVRRLCIHYDILKFLSSKPYSSGVRSFVYFSSEKIVPLPDDISSIVGAFELLRVLSVRPLNLDHFPIDITQLIHLRYLVLSGNFKILPAAFSNLWNMQTLVIETSSNTLVIEADIWKMTQLRHIITNSSTSLPIHPFRTGNNDSLIHGNLQILSTVAPESCKKDVFVWAPNLKKLGIRGRLSELLEGTGGFNYLCNLNYLVNLKLLSDVYPYPPFDGRLISLPQVDAFPPNLKKLTISGTLLDWDHMSTLGMLENLEILKLKDDAFKGNQWQTEKGGFRNLKFLYIGRTDLVSWRTSAHHLPSLRCLHLKHCSKLKAVPLCLSRVSNLQIMDLYCTTKSAAASARRIQQHKQSMRAQKENQGTGFKLSIYPPN